MSADLRGFAEALAVVTLIVVAVGLLVAFGRAEPRDGGPAVACATRLEADHLFTVDEANRRFMEANSGRTFRSGTVKLTVINPKNALKKHGIAIDGGIYDNVKGASVDPGRATSLTISLPPGSYTIFDPYEDNRERGYSTRIVVMGEALDEDDPCFVSPPL